MRRTPAGELTEALVDAIRSASGYRSEQPLVRYLVQNWHGREGVINVSRSDGRQLQIRVVEKPAALEIPK